MFCGMAFVNKGSFICTGTLLPDRQSVLTAAHCVDNIPGFDGREGNVLTDRRLRLGTQNISVDDGLFAIDAVVIHGGYSKATKLDDIALVRVAGDPRIAEFEAKGRLAAVPLMGAADRDFDAGEALRVTGWGWMGQRRTPAALVTTLGVALLLRTTRTLALTHLALPSRPPVALAWAW